MLLSYEPNDMSHAILVVEDEARLAQAICKYLHAEGYRTRTVENGAEAVNAAKVMNPDLILLDIMLPDLNGVDVCQAIREFSAVPIIMLTAKVEQPDRLAGFKVGADDYVCKPFNPQELMYRIAAVLRRTTESATSNDAIYTYGEVTLNSREHSVYVGNQPVTLTNTEFLILQSMLANPNQVFSREDLLELIKGRYIENYARAVDWHIKNLRKKINILPGMALIKTLYAVGYKLD